MARGIIKDTKASLAFDGAGDAVTLGSPAALQLNTFSVKFWIKPRQRTAAHTIYSTNFSGGSGAEVRLLAGNHLFFAKQGVIAILDERPKVFADGWTHHVLTYNHITGEARHYTNGEFTSVATNSQNFTHGDVRIGGKSGDLNAFLSGFRIYNRVLTPAEVKASYEKAALFSGLVLNLPLDEGAGTVANDLSGNNLHGTIVGATWTSDAPTKKRSRIGENLVPNGDFSMVPPFTAATVGQSRVIDGTSTGAGSQLAGSGSTYGYPTEAKKIFRWNINTYNTTSPSVQYDTVVKKSGIASMRLQGTAIKERVNITLGNRNFADLNDPVDIKTNLMPIKPNTTYKYSVWMKQDASNVVGNPQGIRVIFWAHSPTGITGGAVNATPPSPNGTFDWVKVEGTITTSATARYMNVYATISGNSTDYYDATGWFDEFELYEIVATTRPPALNFKNSLQIGTARSANGIHDIAATDGTLICSVDIVAFNGNTVMGWYGDNGTPDSLRLNIEGTGYPFVFGVNPTPAGAVLTKPTMVMPKNVWTRFAMTYNKTTGLGKLYMNGQLIGSGNYLVRPSSTIQFYTSVGNISDVKAFARELTAEEIAAEYGGKIISDPLLRWKLDDGVGHGGVIDTSGKNNNGTYQGGSTFSAEVPSQKRLKVGGNLIKNGDLSYQPPFSAATNISARWIDGTTGSITNDVFGWYFTNTGGGQTARFEDNALRIDATVAGGGTSGQVITLGTAVSPSTTTQRQYFVPVLPSTSYTLKAKIKTQNVTSAAAGGARIRMLLYDGLNTASITSVSLPYITGTNDYQEVSITINTTANTRFINPWLNLYGETGTVWFKDVTLTPTTNTSRQAA